MPAWLIGLAIAAAVLLFARKTSGPSPAIAGGAKRKGASKLNDDLLTAATELVPDASTVLRPGDPRIDPVYGGRMGDRFGAPAWGYYQVLLDANGKKGGTTCVITLGYLMGRSGWPADMVNRPADDKFGAPGSGMRPGSMKVIDAAKVHGFYKLPELVGAAWLPGDAYHIDHPPRPNSDHVGTVASVSDPAADGTRQVETIDGGQGAGADIKRNVRTLSADGKTLALGGDVARVLGVIRADGGAVA